MSDRYIPNGNASSVRQLFLALAALLGLVSAARAQCPEGWLQGEQQAGFTSNVYCMTTWDPDGAGPLPARLVVGSTGDIPGLQSTKIAMYDGANWIALGDGFNSSVNALAVYNGDLYAGGDFTATGSISCRYLARWTGTTWVQVGTGTGLNSSVNALAVYNSELYIGGVFTALNGSGSVTRIARWNGTTVNPVGTGGMDSTVYALGVYNGQLYAGGSFATAGGIAAGRVASWNGTTWAPLAGGVGTNASSPVYCFGVSNGLLYVGGGFTTVDGAATSANYIASWNGTTWGALGVGASNGTNSTVQAIQPYGADLYVGGSFSASGGNNGSYLSRWNGSTWNGFGSSVNSPLYAMTVFNNELYFAGSISQVQSLAVRYIARWNGVNFAALGNGLAGRVYALTPYNGQMHAMGTLTSAGSTLINNIARFDGTNWQPLGSGVNTTARAAIVYNGNLIVGGDFTSAGGIAANYVAMWNGSTWSEMPGLNGTVYCFAISGGQLYAGGSFTGLCVRWTGSSWVAVGSPALSSTVQSLIDFGGILYAGGNFSAAGPTPLNYVARLSGNTWQPVGAGFNGAVNSFAIYNNNLYAGGSFTTDSTGGTPIRYVARFNGSSWEQVGAGANTTVFAIRSFANELVATGSFTTIGGIGAPYVGRWNGVQWRALAEGLSVGSPQGQLGNALSDLNGLLYVGGAFLRSGLSASSPAVARWSPGGGTLTFTQSPGNQTVCATGTAAFSVQTSGTPIIQYQWRKDGVPLFNGRGISGAATNNLTIAYVEPGDAGVYDCIAFNACGPLASLPGVLTIDTGCSPPCNPDFNNDGNADAGDVDALINVIAGGGCP
ncbi:MAG: immunoglobulin domain-containing protein [Phycisphaerales bacterium]|jgi:hypothetical protein